MIEKTRILIVDDDPSLRDTLADVLNVKGYLPLAVATGKEALQVLVEEMPPVALIDIRLEDMSGLDVLQEVKESSPRTECILVTGHASQASAIEALNLCAYSYILKPYGMDQLLLRIQRAIEKRETEQALRESEERFRDITHSMADWVWEVDTSGRYTYVSDTVQNVLGYTPDELLGKTPFELMPVKEGARIKEEFLEIVSQSAPIVDLENYNLTKGGTEICLLTNGVPMVSADGGLAGYRGVDKDITSQKILAAEKATIQLQLQQAQRLESVGALAGGIAHEFNNILTTIIGNTHMAIGDIKEESPARECLDEIQLAASRAEDVVRQLLGFARKSVFQLQPIHLGSVIREAMVLIRASFPTTIEIQQDLSCESDTVLGDASQISMLLINLCTNAENAMHAKGGELAVTLENTALEKSAVNSEGLEPGDYLKMMVRDTGNGIDPRIIDRVFEPYFTTRNLAEASGMGLAVVHGIVKRHHGAITVESEPGKGTVFEVMFPLHKTETLKIE